MPNHVHGIIVIENNGDDNNNGTDAPRGRDAPWRVSTAGFGPLKHSSLPSIINHFKGNVKRWCNKNGFPNFAWQARFHDHIIRNREELNNIRQYIIDNPNKWEFDRNNPTNF